MQIKDKELDNLTEQERNNIVDNLSKMGLSEDDIDKHLEKSNQNDNTIFWR